MPKVILPEPAFSINFAAPKKPISPPSITINGGHHGMQVGACAWYLEGRSYETTAGTLLRDWSAILLQYRLQYACQGPGVGRVGVPTRYSTEEACDGPQYHTLNTPFPLTPPPPPPSPDAHHDPPQAKGVLHTASHTQDPLSLCHTLPHTFCPPSPLPPPSRCPP
jgi:hypothetical protein